MPSARASSGSKSFIIAIAVFVVLFLASMVSVILLYRERESNLQAREKAESDLQQIAGRAEISMLKPLVGRSEGPGRTSAAAELIADTKSMAEMILGRGQATSDLVALWEEVVVEYQSVEDTLAAMELEPAISPERGLAGIVQQLIQLVGELQYANLKKDNQITQIDTQREQEMEARDAEIAELRNQLYAEQQTSQTHEVEYAALHDQLAQRNQARQEEDQLQIQDQKAQLRKLQEANRKMDEDIKKYQTVVNQLNERLRAFQPPPIDTTALEADGYIVDVNEREGLAYINLAKGDQLYRGLKFGVYDRFRGIPQGGEGKGAVEVIEIMDTISRCRITHFDKSDPIMNKDIIANLVWNKDKKYNFCVSGDFDFDGDGRADQKGLQQVTELITRWGGSVTSTLSVETDFLVLGQAPSVPVKPSDEYGVDSPIINAYMRANDRVKEYQTVIEKGKALDVPTFNLNRFLYFVGYHEKTPTKN